MTLPFAGAGRGVSPFARRSQTTAPPGPGEPPPATVPLTATGSTRSRNARGDGVSGALGVAETCGGKGGAFSPERADDALDVGVEAGHAQELLPLRGGRRELARVPRELAAREQVEDEVLLLG